MATRPNTQFVFPEGPSLALSGQSDTPVLLEQLSELGMVFQSPHPFPIGTRVAIGLHLCPDCGSACGEGEFLIVDGVVVECHSDTAAGAPGFSVTLLFESLSRPDQARLRRAMGCCQSGKGTISPLGGHHHLPTFGPN